MEQKKSPIKERILQYADMLGISRRKFYEKIGVSRGTLESNTGITEDIMSKFIAVFPNISPEWLITGKGEMLRKNVVIDTSTRTGDNSKISISQCKDTQKNNVNTCQSCEEKERIIEALKETVEAQKKTIIMQEENIIFLRRKNENMDAKNAADAGAEAV